jgi:RNA-directed DNA polymerase
MKGDIKGRTIINRLYAAQKGCCSHCGRKITLETDFRLHHVGSGTESMKYLVHPDCHEKLHALKLM